MRGLHRVAATAGSAAAALVAAVAAPLVPVSAQGSPAAGDVPVRGTFSYSSGNTDGEAEIRGAVHGVRRIPGGTAVYYSLGVAAGETLSPDRTMPTIGLSDAYAAGDAFAVRLLDPKGLRIYKPMVGADGCLCAEVYDFGSESGTLSLGWAVLPPLPAAVSTVSVQIGYGTVEDVPVEAGALLPAVAEAPLRLGAGWPQLPLAADVAAVPTPDTFVRPLVRHTADLKRTVTVNEQPGQVAEDLAADVLFAVGSAELTPAARATLQQVAARVKTRAKGEVRIVGHTDVTGSDADNQRLSEARARSVRDALAAGVGPAVTLNASGRGEAEPVADDATPEGRQANRRVTVTYAVQDGS